MDAIEVSNLSKMYRLGSISTGTISHDLNRWWHKMRGLEDPYAVLAEANARESKGDSEYVWSLKDVNFTVKQGEILGIIGRNGAGKSTLLKILSRVTGPTTGAVKMRGRVASLLEVGTGFHPELTGRENIFLNGAILGMTKKEIAKKFDEIVDFSGVERYIDTPVKRYSSGMYVRLAFAVAAHLEPEILIIDEVLAVGDADFQRKCIGKISDVSSSDGRTVLFVSHNMAAVKSMCTRGLVLEQGTVRLIGSADSAVSYYLKGDTETVNKKVFVTEFDLPEFRINEISLSNSGKSTDSPLSENLGIDLVTDLDIKTNNPEDFHVTYHLNNEEGERLFSFYSLNELKLNAGKNRLVCSFPAGFFNPGTFYLTIFIVKDKANPQLIEKDIMTFTVVDGERELGVWMGREPGYIKPRFKWSNK